MAQPTIDTPQAASHLNSGSSEALEQVRQALIGLRFGTITIIVQDGVVIQLERTEKRRLRKSDRM
jgi:hypothetical protein